MLCEELVLFSFPLFAQQKKLAHPGSLCIIYPCFKWQDNLLGHYIFVCGCRRWIQAVFRLSADVNASSSVEASHKKEFTGQEYVQPKVKGDTVISLVDNSEVDISEGVAVDMFGISPSNDNQVKFPSVFLFQGVHQIP